MSEEDLGLLDPAVAAASNRPPVTIAWHSAATTLSLTTPVVSFDSIAHLALFSVLLLFAGSASTNHVLCIDTFPVFCLLLVAHPLVRLCSNLHAIGFAWFLGLMYYAMDIPAPTISWQ